MRVLPLFLACVCASANAQFEPNASLASENLRTWRTAPARDQAAAMTDIVVKILNISDPIAARNKAVTVQACVNKTAADFMAGERRVVDVALACIAQLGYFR